MGGAYFLDNEMILKKLVCLIGLLCAVPGLALAAAGESDKWQFFVQGAYMTGNSFAPAGKVFKNSYSDIDNVLFNDSRSDLFNNKISTYELQVGYGKKNVVSLLIGGTMVDTGELTLNNAKTIFVSGGSHIVGSTMDIKTSAKYQSVYGVVHLSYPKILNRIAYFTLNLISSGIAGTVVSFLNPSFYLDLGPEFTMAQLKYSGDLDFTESYSGFGMHMGVGMEFNITESIVANVGMRSGFSLSQFFDESDGFTRIHGYRFGLKYYF